MKKNTIWEASRVYVAWNEKSETTMHLIEKNAFKIDSGRTRILFIASQRTQILSKDIPPLSASTHLVCAASSLSKRNWGERLLRNSDKISQHRRPTLLTYWTRLISPPHISLHQMWSCFFSVASTSSLLCLFFCSVVKLRRNAYSFPHVFDTLFTCVLSSSSFTSLGKKEKERVIRVDSKDIYMCSTFSFPKLRKTRCTIYGRMQLCVRFIQFNSVYFV